MKHKYSFLVTLFLICCASFMFFYMLFLFDNKYSVKLPTDNNGIIDLSDNNFDKNQVFQLAYSWDVYPNQCLLPSEVKDNPAPLKIFLGQYSGIDFGIHGNPYFGSATYHLKIALPSETKSYSLEIPEIFSAYKLYINGRLFSSCGDISSDNHTSRTKNSCVSFMAKDGVEIVINAANYEHFYGGLIYPPAFGTHDGVYRLLTTRIVYRSMLIFISFTLGSLFLFAGICTNKIYISYTILSLLFIGYISYPITHTFYEFGLWIYKLETICYYGFITLIIYIQDKLCSFNKDKYDYDNDIFTIHNISVVFEHYIRIFIYIFSFVILALTLVPATIVCSNKTLIYIYSNLRTYYKYTAFLYLIISSAFASFKDIKYSKLLLTGFCIVGVSFFADRLFPLYEPIYCGWFYEHSGFILLCIIGITLLLTFSDYYTESNKLAFQLDMQKNYYNVVKENIYNTRKLRHNINNHILVMKSLLKEHNNEKLWQYLENYTQELPEFKSILFCENQTLNVLISYYYNSALGKKIEVQIERFEIKNDIIELEPDLCVLFGNLFTNAIEACENIHNGKKLITINVHTQGNVISIVFKNTFENAPVIIDNAFLSSKRVKQEGIGIPSIKNIVNKYNGQYKFNINNKDMMFEAYSFIIIN